jgi:hypothetical protein
VAIEHVDLAGELLKPPTTIIYQTVTMKAAVLTIDECHIAGAQIFTCVNTSASASGPRMTCGPERPVRLVHPPLGESSLHQEHIGAGDRLTDAAKLVHAVIQIATQRRAFGQAIAFGSTPVSVRTSLTRPGAAPPDHRIGSLVGIDIRTSVRPDTLWARGSGDFRPVDHAAEVLASKRGSIMISPQIVRLSTVALAKR